jgi:hypothetical protein
VARPVLTPWRWRAVRAVALVSAWALASCSAAQVAPPATPDTVCAPANPAEFSPAQLTDASTLALRLKRGALHAALTQRYGSASGCSVEAVGPDLRVTETFRDGVSVELGGQQAIELSETKVVIRDASEADAIALLKLAERDAFGPDGCDIDWDRPEAAAHAGPKSESLLHELVFRGTACQCQGRLRRGGDPFVVLILRATC